MTADGQSTQPAPAGDGEAARYEAVRYEVVFDCRDRMVGGRLARRLEDATDPAWQAQLDEEGPTWTITLGFPDDTSADRFFRGDVYRQFCIDVRRSARSSVLVVPLGTPEQ